MIMRKNQLFIPAVLTIIAILFAVPNTGLSFADSDTKTTVKVADHLKNNPLALKIIAEMEAQKARYNQQQEQQEEKKIQQDRLEQQRKIANQSLQQDLESMQKKYEDYTPKNAFARFVASLDPTYHPIYWSQFEYLSAKVKLASAARDAVLENGGTFFEGQKEYYKYASMTRVEMVNLIEDFNVQHGFAKQNVQEYFDAYGKLPRYEDDADAPCYGCENQHDKNTNTQTSFNDNKNTLQGLKDRLSELRAEFFDEKQTEQKMQLVNSMNEVVKQIQKLAYDGKSL